MQKPLFIALLLFYSYGILAQEKTADSTKTEKSKTKNIDFNVMPYISYNRTLDFMFGAIPMMMYKTDKTDTISPKSLSGLTAIYTTNKSYFICSFNKWHFNEDKWRAQLFLMTGNQNSQFFMDDFDAPTFYDYSTETTLVSVSLLRKIFKSFYGGLGYSYAHYDTAYEDDIQPASTSHTNGLQTILLYDTRDAIYYPTKGNKIRARWISYPEWFGNEVNANKIISEYNSYYSVRDKKDVVAARFAGKFGLGNISFEQQVTIGNDDIRGYSEGKYRGDGLMAIQGEYRYNFNKRMGAVGFAGLATIYGSDTPSFDWKLYPGAGVGYRYRAFKNEKFNVGLDGAVGKGDWGIYFRIGEAF
ncbi:BamA/TamA family outer membrane protein [Flavobacterium sp. KACC 22761]|uniref:BamA/TamA family outer membrane protein n=1 Tax=Flavobacterium sp. KACC 22761 TaxID=3092665 RepID=UPI002A74DE5D|nr:BamA/TamA family outer membrane protein [Flavobacterium sp. KACC 22761]WPO77818.1 BamA/TamA family outer membrane protein [Flavobacterium sp. KACC 22761]